MDTAINLTVSMPLHRVLDLIINAFDTSAIGYWLVNDKHGDNHRVTWPDGIDGNSFDPATLGWLLANQLPWDSRKLYFAPFLAGGSVTLFVDPQDAPRGRVVLDYESIKRGLAALLDQYPQVFAAVLTEDDDAETADVFVQCCAFGKVIYG